MRSLCLSLLLGLAVLGCGGDDTGEEGDAGGDPAVVNPAQACEDFADAVGSSAERCGFGTYQQNHDAVIAQLGGCDRVVGIRDAVEYYDQCIPALQAISCESLSAGDTPESCAGQLQVQAG